MELTGRWAQLGGPSDAGKSPDTPGYQVHEASLSCFFPLNKAFLSSQGTIASTLLCVGRPKAFPTILQMCRLRLREVKSHSSFSRGSQSVLNLPIHPRTQQSLPI